MNRYCELCGEGIQFVLDNNKPTIGELNNLIDSVEILGKYIECGDSKELCLPLKRLAGALKKAEKETKKI